MKKKRARLKSADLFLEPDFPLTVRRHLNHGSSRTLHSHEFHELVIIFEGTGRHVTDEEEYGIEAGDVFLIRGDTAHGYAETRGVHLVNILFAPKRLRLPLGELRDVPGYHVLFHLEPRLRRQHRFQSKLHLAVEELAQLSTYTTDLETELSRTRPGYRFIARTLLMQILGFLSRCYSQTHVSEARTMVCLGEVLSYLERNYAEAISLARLAREARMSQSTLVRTFRQAVGTSPIDYLIRLRIEKASALLRRGDVRVGEAALGAGFSDSNYFSRLFRKATGMSPRQYRARYLAGDGVSVPGAAGKTALGLDLAGDKL
ncbi:MAG: helix-turn-helix domain-containing protein [Kiritimatiellae bacterium]|nr:helix-turn-helix domain-containing protein [Kiritimatiellia bacterium]